MTKHDPFIMLPHAVYDSPVFVALRPIHLAMLLVLLRRYSGFNNGNIALGTRAAAERCHCNQSTACRAFAHLQAVGLISATYKGHLVPEIGRPDVATRWKLNFIRESAHIRAISNTDQRSPNASSGWSPSASSLVPAVRSPSASSPGDAGEERYLDNLTARGHKKVMPARVRCR